MDKGPPTFRVRIPAPRVKAVEKKTDAGRFRISPRQRGYNAKWDRESLAFRQENPFCRFCEMLGRDELGAVVDHIVPPRNAAGEIDQKLFWSRKNWQVLCAHHHDVTKQKMELEAEKQKNAGLLRIWCADVTTWPASIRIA